MKKVFISYKRNVSPDAEVVADVLDSLSSEFDVFIDQKMLVGTPWAERIENELRETDFLIPFLSEASVDSEMVLAEIETAHHLAKSRNGKPKILPIRVSYEEAFVYPLSAYLNRINWAIWNNEKDTENLIEQLRRAILEEEVEDTQQVISNPSSTFEEKGVPKPLHSAQPIKPERPQGTMSKHSAFYIPRDSDDIALKTIEDQGVTITIKGPRQIGKSSLLVRIMEHARFLGKSVAFIDFQFLEQASLQDSKQFFREFCIWISDELNVPDATESFWSKPYGNVLKCKNYMQRHILKELGGHVVLAMDEVERVFAADFRADFFSMLRGWHNMRPDGEGWELLDLALVTSTEPYQFINDLNQSPFNVGEIISLEDFTLEQAQILNELHPIKLSNSEIKHLHYLVGGHPYLIRQALYLISSNRMTVSELFDTATAYEGPFGDHLRSHLFRLQGRSDLVDALKEILSHERCTDELIYFRLSGAGLVKRGENTGDVLMRCDLYRDFFGEYL